MALPLIFAKLMETGTNLINNVFIFASQDKSAEAINKLVEPQMEAYRAAMRQIEEADDISTERKTELLKDVADEIGKMQHEANIKLQVRQRDASEIATKIIFGVLSAGTSLAPEFVKMLKSDHSSLSDSENETVVESETIEEENNSEEA